MLWPIKLLLNFCLPYNCVLCHRRGQILCRNCQQLIQFYPAQIKEQLESSEFIDQAYVLGFYQPPLNNLVKALKYKSVKAAAEVMADLIYLHLPPISADIMTFVPSSRLRTSNRGYNQAQLIANYLSNLWKISNIKLLKKTKHTRKQASLASAKLRVKNLANSYELNCSLAKIENKKIIIVDDVISTGATVNTCAQILKQAGAKKVITVAVARS